jgi:hypothetical protein
MTMHPNAILHGRVRETITLVVAATAMLVGLVASAAAPASARPASGSSDVVPIAWGEFTAGLPDDEQAERTRAILLNTNRYALQTWFPQTYGSQGAEYLDLGGTGEGNIRPPGSEALSLAVSVATGAYDEATTGFPEEHAEDVAARLLKSIAYNHTANRPNGWGDAWQSALWAYNAGFAGWLLWDQLEDDDRALVGRMMVHEADRFLHYTVPYYQDADGNVVTPGDTKAEENAWNAAFLNLAVAMMPTHPNRAVWQDKAIELMVSAYSTPSDLENSTELNGKPVAEWLDGSNVFDDGTMVNHGFIHPDYFTSIANSAGSPAMYGLAGLPAPRAAVFNADLVYSALVDHQFDSPPYDAPGGTIYVRDSDGAATANVYYPQGNDWGTSRQLHFLLIDTLADVFGFDGQVSEPASDWAAAHATRALEMQSRFDDGRTYGDLSEDTYSGREQWVALLASRAYLTLWVDHNNAVEFTNRAYPVTPEDYPGASVSIEAAPQYIPGETTPVSIELHNESEIPLLELSAQLDLPDGWAAELVDQPSRRDLRLGKTATWTWNVTLDEDAAEGSTAIRGTVGYLHYGRQRELEATAYVQVPPGRNVALGRPTEVSSVLRAIAGGDKAVDGLFNDASRWLSAADDPAPWITIDLGDVINIDSVYVYSGYQQTNHDPTTMLVDFTVEVRSDGEWQEVAAVVDNREHLVALRDVAAHGDQVRLLISDPSRSSIDVARVFEVEVYGEATS